MNRIRISPCPQTFIYQGSAVSLRVLKKFCISASASGWVQGPHIPQWCTHSLPSAALLAGHGIMVEQVCTSEETCAETRPAISQCYHMLQKKMENRKCVVTQKNRPNRNRHTTIIKYSAQPKTRWIVNFFTEVNTTELTDRTTSIMQRFTTAIKCRFSRVIDNVGLLLKANSKVNSTQRTTHQSEWLTRGKKLKAYSYPRFLKRH